MNKEEIEELYVSKGMTIREVAKRLGVSTGYIHKQIHELGIQARKCGFPPGLHMPKESVERSVEKRRGVKRSEETKKRISEARKIHCSGHRKKRADGYVAVYFPDHINASKCGYIMEHALVMESEIGRPLRSDEVVHHINHKRDDNRIENLQLMTKHDHMSMHMKERWEQKRKGVMTYQ